MLTTLNLRLGLLCGPLSLRWPSIARPFFFTCLVSETGQLARWFQTATNFMPGTGLAFRCSWRLVTGGCLSDLLRTWELVHGQAKVVSAPARALTWFWLAGVLARAPAAASIGGN